MMIRRQVQILSLINGEFVSNAGHMIDFEWAVWCGWKYLGITCDSSINDLELLDKMIS
jgi:hypothetical protein